MCELVKIDLEEGGHIVDMLWYYILHFAAVAAQQSANDVVIEWSVDWRSGTWISRSVSVTSHGSIVVVVHHQCGLRQVLVEQCGIE